jgi:hypothetical protein
MTQATLSGTELPLRPEEELVPYDHWLSWLKNLALECIRNAHLALKKGWKHDAIACWMVLIAHALFNLPLGETADRLNKLLWRQHNARLRHKVKPRTYKGRRVRKDRKCPNGDQVRNYRNALPDWVVKRLNRFIFERQLDYALQEELITTNIDLIADNTDQWYYGGDRYPVNPFITAGYNGPGTKHKRKYLALMLKCGTTYLYVGCVLVKKGASNVPDILGTADWLLAKGFKIRHLLADRWFPTHELLSHLPRRGITYIGPYKKWAPVRRAIEAYIKKGGKGKYILPYAIHGAPATCYGQAPVQCWIIFANGQGRRLRGIRRDYLSGKESLADCVKEIMPVLTTAPPPSGPRARQVWAEDTCRAYNARWHVETGFRDLNRLAPPSNARTNGRKLFMCAVRYWVFNAWQLERAKRRRLRRCPKVWRKGPTLRQFTEGVLALEVGE